MLRSCRAHETVGIQEQDTVLPAIHTFSRPHKIKDKGERGAGLSRLPVRHRAWRNQKHRCHPCPPMRKFGRRKMTGDREEGETTTTLRMPPPHPSLKPMAPYHLVRARSTACCVVRPGKPVPFALTPAAHRKPPSLPPTRWPLFSQRPDLQWRLLVDHSRPRLWCRPS